jgi:hypothetical protein
LTCFFKIFIFILTFFDVFLRIFYEEIYFILFAGFRMFSFSGAPLIAVGMPFLGVSVGANVGGSFAGVGQNCTSPNLFFGNTDMHMLSQGKIHGSGLGGLFLGAGHTFQNGFHFSASLEEGLSRPKGFFISKQKIWNVA